MSIDHNHMEHTKIAKTRICFLSRKVLTTLLVCLLFLALTACGTGTPVESGTDPTSAPGTSEPVTASSAEPTENTPTEATVSATTTAATAVSVNDEPEVKALWCLEFARAESEPCPDTTGIYLAADKAKLRQILEGISRVCGDADQFPAGRSVFSGCAYLCEGEKAYSGESSEMLYSPAELAGEFDDAFFNGAKAIIIVENVPYDDGFASGRGIVFQTEDGLLLSTEMVPNTVDLFVGGKKLYVSCWRVEDSAWENGSLTYETMYGQVLTQDEEIRKQFRFPIPVPEQ